MMRSKYIFSKLVQRQNVRYYSVKMRQKLKPEHRKIDPKKAPIPQLLPELEDYKLSKYMLRFHCQNF